MELNGCICNTERERHKERQRHKQTNKKLIASLDLWESTRDFSHFYDSNAAAAAAAVDQPPRLMMIITW